MNTTFYIPINSNGLAHYFNKALILPSSYFQNRPEDIQNKLKNSILLSKNKWIKNTDCSIEIILTEKEISEIKKISDIFYCLEFVLPISRIKKIRFLDTEQMQTTIWNINNGAAFVPPHLISVNENSTEFTDDDFESNFDKEDNPQQEENKKIIRQKINRFDTILGALAFMKIAIYSIDGVWTEFSKNYFSTLSYFNKLIEEQTIESEKQNGLDFSKKYTGTFVKDSHDWSEWQPYIYRNINLSDIESIANEKNIKIEKKLGFIILNSIDSQSYLYDLAILAMYGNKKSKGVDDLVNNLHNGTIFQEKVEQIAFLFGLNTGYSNLRNKYNNSNKEFIVKFQLDNKLDYYTIESIYQFAFNSKKDNYRFDFIDQLDIDKQKQTKILGFETYTILDKTIIIKKKPTPLEVFLQEYSLGIYEKLSDDRNQSLPNFVKFDKEMAINYFKTLLGNELKTSAKQFEERVISDYKEMFEYEKENLILSYEQHISILESEKEKLKIEIREVDTKKPNYKIDYDKLSLSQLKEEARNLDIKGLSKYKIENKDELIYLIIKKNNKQISLDI